MKAVFFDFGGIVIRTGKNDILRRLATLLKVSYPRLERVVGKKWPGCLNGKMSESEVSAIVEKSLSVRGVEKKWLKAIRDCTEIDNGVMEIVRELKAGHVVGVISNVTRMTAMHNRSAGLYKEFFPVVLSCEVGTSKPGRGIYRAALMAAGLKPGECAFIDNEKGNLVQPKRMGFKVIHFKSAGQLRKDLKKLGIMDRGK